MLLGTLVISSILHVVIGLTTTRYMTSYCNTPRPVFVNDSIILELTNQLLEDRVTTSVHCTTWVKTDQSRQLLLHFISLDISHENQTPDSFHIFDVRKSGKLKRLTPPSGLYGLYDKYHSHTSSGVGDYMSSGHKLKLQYQGSPTLTFSGFRVLITAVKKSHSDGSCSGLYGHCPGKDICIPYSVWCDGDNNCGQGDDSDESTCHLVVSDDWEYKCVTIMASVTALVAIAIFIFTILTVICILRRYNRNFMRRHSITVVAQRNENGKWQITNDMGLTLSMAPPMYDDVVDKGEEEDPPPYDLVTNVSHSSPACSRRQSRNGYTVVECHMETGEIVSQPLSAIANPQVQNVDMDKTPHGNEERKDSPIMLNIADTQADDSDSVSSSEASSSSARSTINNNGPDDKKIVNDKKLSSKSLESGNCIQNLTENESKNNKLVCRHTSIELLRQYSAVPMDDDIEYIDEEEIPEEAD